MNDRKSRKVLMDLQKVNEHNAEGCLACGRKFNLGDTAVVACGGWGDQPKLIHENEAVYDTATSSYVERRCYMARRND